MSIAIRLASDSDAQACAEIVNYWIDSTGWLPRVHSRQVIEKMIAAGIPMREFWVAGDLIVGYLSFNTAASQVMGLYTSPPGQGVGRALMDQVKVNRSWIQLWSDAANTHAHRFYRREGFVEVGQKRAGADGIPEIRMVCGR